MDAGPGTRLGALGWFVGVWVTMTAAMMLPSALPMVALYSRTARGRPADTVAFVCGYLGAWTAYGLAAYGLYRLLDATAGAQLAWHRAGPWVAGGAIAAAGLYQLSSLKARCLRHCRSPLHFLLAGWRKGTLGGARMGAEHGAWCVGCCWGLMLVLFAVGVMSIFWMAVIAAAIFVEKLLPGGERVARALALALVVLGVWVAAAPGSVPHLTQPGSGSMRMPAG